MKNNQSGPLICMECNAEKSPSDVIVMAKYLDGKIKDKWDDWKKICKCCYTKKFPSKKIVLEVL